MNIIGKNADVEISTVEGVGVAVVNTLKSRSEEKTKLTIDAKNITLKGGSGTYFYNGEVTLKASEDMNIKINDKFRTYSDTGRGVQALQNSKATISGKSVNIENAVFGIDSSNSVVDIDGDLLNIKVVDNAPISLNFPQGQEGIDILSRDLGVVNINSNKSTLMGKGALYSTSGGKINFGENGQHNIIGSIEAEGKDSAISIKGNNGNKITSNVETHSNGAIDISVVNGKLYGDVEDGYYIDKKDEVGTIKLNLSSGEWANHSSSSVTEVKMANGHIRFAEGTGIHIGKLNGTEKGIFHMKLNSKDLSKGNMLYVCNADG